MAISTSFSQASLAVATLTSTVGTYIALSPPNPNVESGPAAGDSLGRLQLTNKHIAKVALAPIGLMALHASTLTYLYPNIPSGVLRHGAQNGLNSNLIKWSTATAIPLALILCAGVPLRLVSYASLGKNFTFALAEPDRLTTTGIYRYIQHPSYTGVVVLIISNVALLGRVDGVLSCWIPPRWYQPLRSWVWALAPVGLSLLTFGIWTRVRQEERMLRTEFGAEWEDWHAATARFIPWIV
ncbi:protein-S-isoprenylcysteine O-methyltransferase [Coleophoma crateriformis]|uniref:Protein-S-isoprenylcysteine O-methyltransferase n=1 Tax=Coleophoma crateriformis TaxID=565419 RepID=A0A3D8RCN0_9HELO|nr:protein-S-isoprenylcysteine O-methyltransferase [Coleophoma crateriformis]